MKTLKMNAKPEMMSHKDLHDLLDNNPEIKVVTTGKMTTDHAGKKFQPVNIIRKGFRSIPALITA